MKSSLWHHTSLFILFIRCLGMSQFMLLARMSMMNLLWLK
ncbi:hypothetical protein CFP56_026514 [Quercus suber]|uniref:Uncharacterized protein n=1 Tax=Quercus suber TaxID=58331 RepID=A0AAW0K1Y7_QUESU